jgi:tripartite-type tricarboxylate transporter receptor subunit TctC
MTFSISTRAVLGAAVSFGLTSVASAETPAEFFKGKTVNMYISSGAGGTNDAYARLIAEHITRHLPGQPNVLPRNMPGAGGLKATKYLYTVAPKDGLAMGVVQRAVSVQPLLGIKGADFNPLEFNWVGSTAQEVSVAVAWKTSKVQSIKEAEQNELVVGSSGVGNDTGAFPRVVNYFLGTKVRPIHGYVSGTDITLAMERGEVHGRFGWSWGSLKSREARWLKDGSIKVILQMGLKKAPDLDAPLVLDLAKTPEDRKAMEVIFAATTIGWPSLLPPKVPAERVAAFRAAYAATVKDAAFVKGAEKRGLELDPLSGEEIQSIIANIYASSPDVVERARKAYAPGGKVEMAKILNAKGKIAKINKKGTRMTIDDGKAKVEARIAGDTKITIAGKSAQRNALKQDMTCAITLVASGAVAHAVACD